MILRYLLVLAVIITITSCAVLTLTPAKFGWPVESVVKVKDDGMLKEDRYAISFNSKPLFFEEAADSNAYLDKELRMIRNDEGYYFITSNGFKNVYVFDASGGSMTLKSKIFISEFGLQKPFFNQRSPYIELVDGDKKLYLDNSGIAKEQ
jgi:hypothetical protein